LEAVDGVTTALSGEKYSTLSWCLPLLSGLHDAARRDGNGCMILMGTKKKLSDQLNERFRLDELEMDNPSVLAAALDPRFQKLSFLSNVEHSEVHEILVEKASIGHCSCSDMSDTPPIKKQQLSVLDHLLSVLDRLLSVLDRLLSVLDRLLSVLDRLLSVLDRLLGGQGQEQWCDRGGCLLPLGALHRKTICLVAWQCQPLPSSCCCEYLLLLHPQVLSVAGIVVDKRHCALNADMINALVFLHKKMRSLCGLNQS